MKRQLLTNKRLSRPGYLLIEGLVSILISVFAVWTIITMISYAGNVKRENTVNFYSYLTLIESDRYQFKVLKHYPNKLILYSPVTDKRYRIEEYKNMVRLTGAYKGHVPAITDIQHVAWHKDRGCLRTDVTFENGQKCSAYSKLPFKD
ncbi:competence type IV pilus minor pilin ComGF [Lentilactobacillus otakiensis]|uniref:competence type IV pilus minor pilin ComGF n=2 Tax=Lentilactobacillus otakiensis TaxID=481720 RepID=UPI003D179CB4